MKRSPSVSLILAFIVLSVAGNTAFAGKPNDTHPRNFIAITADDRAILSWTMPQEKITSHFVVEHSVDGSLFVPLDSIAAGQDNNYRYTHEHADRNPVNYYRLKQLDKNGDATYSHIRVVRFAEKAMVRVEATPNPLANELALTVMNDVRLVIKDSNEKTIYKKKLRPGRYNINSSKWAAGKYDLSIYENGKLVEKKSVFKFADASAAVEAN